MVAVLGLHEIADLTRLEREGRRVELGHHPALPEEIEVAAVWRRAFVLRVLFCELREIGAAPRLLEQCFGAHLHRGVVFSFGLQKDVTRADLFGRLVLREVVVVRSLDVGRGYDDLRADGVGVDEQIFDLPFLRDSEAVLVRVEVAGHFFVGRFHVGPEALDGKRHDRELHLVVAAPVFLFDVLVRDRHPFGQRPAELVDDERAADAFFEIGRRERRVLHLQDLPITIFADERSVLLERRDGEDARPQLSVAHVDLQARGLGERRALVDHLLENLLIDAELLQQRFVHVAAVRRAVRLQLRLIRAAELVRADRLSFDGCDGVGGGCASARAAKEVGNIKDHEGEAHQAQAPFEPAFVPTHPVKHCHSEILWKP